MVLNLKSASFPHGHGQATTNTKQQKLQDSVPSPEDDHTVQKPSTKTRFSFDLFFFANKHKPKNKKPERPRIVTNGTYGTNSNVRLCQSPGGRQNVHLAIPVTPPGAQQKTKTNAKPRLMDDDDVLRDSLRSSSLILRESTIDEFLACFPRDLVPDIRQVCQLRSRRHARQYVFSLLQASVFEIRSTKWGAYFLQLIRSARSRRLMTSEHASSLRWVVLAHVRREVGERNRQKAAMEKQMARKMTEYRVAMQCVCNTTILKYGRKGKPHVTQLSIENGDCLRWTSKFTAYASKSKRRQNDQKQIRLASIKAIRAGPTTDVLTRALQKGTLALEEAKCTLSLITDTRTLDLKAKNAAEREWLHRSFQFLVELAREHEKQLAQQVELTIMKRIECMNVWKHGRKGRPHKTRLFINRFGEISWLGRSNETIQLDEIVSISLGHQTAVFARSLSCGLASARTTHCCFSLVTHARTLDIETESEQVRDWFVVAFRYLMDKVHEKTAAIKREKAERQLKMLQELCSGIGITTPPHGVPAPGHEAMLQYQAAMAS